MPGPVLEWRVQPLFFIIYCGIFEDSLCKPGAGPVKDFEKQSAVIEE